MVWRDGRGCGRGRGGATLACVGTAEWLYSVQCAVYSALYMRVVHCTEAGPDQPLIIGDYFSDLPKVPPMSQPREHADPASSSRSAARAGARPRAWSRDPGRGRAAKISFLQSAVSGGSCSGARVCVMTTVPSQQPQPFLCECEDLVTPHTGAAASSSQPGARCQVQNMEVVLAAWIMSLTTTTSPPSRRGGVRRGGTGAVIVSWCCVLVSCCGQ